MLCLSSSTGLLCCLTLWALFGGASGQNDDPLAIQDYNGTWAMRAEWSGQVAGDASQSIEPPIAIPAGLSITVVLGGHSDNEAAVLTLQCTGLGYVAKTLTTATYGIAIENWAFASGGSCGVAIDNPSSAPLNTFFLLSMVDTPGAKAPRSGAPWNPKGPNASRKKVYTP